MPTAFVAPDFDARAQCNTLRVKPEYRITLRLGEIDDLFEHDPGTAAGRMERLLVLGLFYFPLGHQRAAARFEKTWKWFKGRILSGKGGMPKTDPEADAILKTALKCRIVGGAVPADWSAPASELPPDAADPAAPEEANFAKIRLPGGFATNFGTDHGIEINLDRNFPAAFGTNTLQDHELQFYDDKTVLGKIPLVAKVERRPPGGGDWAPAEKVDVHFQLVPAYDLPPYDPGRDPSEQFNRPPLRETNGARPEAGTGLGPKKRYDKEESFDPRPDDPQGRNCHKNYGGKRGAGIEAIFSLDKTPGFHEPRAGRKLSHKPYEVAKAAPTAHKHAVAAPTNAEGEAGVLFMPSRQGGDRFRLRAYLPITGDGASAGSVAATTGTFVVWRNIRVSRILRQDLGPSVDSRLLTQALTGSYGISSEAEYFKKAGAHDGTGPVGLPSLNLGTTDHTMAGNAYDPMSRHFARAFCELELDPDAVETLSADDFNEAWRQAAEDAATHLKHKDHKKHFDLIQFLDVKALFCRDLTFSTPESTVCNVPMRTIEDYDAMVPKKKRFLANNLAQDTIEQVIQLADAYALNGFLRVLTWNGALPGLTLVCGGLGHTWQLLIGPRHSGRRRNFRGAFLWKGGQIYKNFIYDYTGNGVHELGHALFRLHAPPDPGKLPDEIKQHDAHADSLCLMSYKSCTGHYCGKCLMALRGWNIAPMT